MRKKLATIATSGLLIGMLALPAQAATSGDATLSVSVNASASIVFTDASAAFGAQNAGSTTEQLATLTYETATNSASGLTLTVTPGATTGPVSAAAPAPSNKVAFELRRNGESTYTDMNNSAGTWRTTSGASTDVFQDDVRVSIGSIAAAGAASQIVTYAVVAN